MIRRKNSKKFIHYKLRESYIINCGSFVLLQIGVTVIINWEKSVITAWAKCYYKLGQAFGEQLLLQIGTTIILRIKIYCKLEQVWQIRTLVRNTSFCLSLSFCWTLVNFTFHELDILIYVQYLISYHSLLQLLTF